MKKYLFLWISSAILFSCNEDERPVVCDTANPLEDIAWIKAAVEEYSSSELSEYTYLSQASYQGETVFFFGSCCPNCNWALIVRDCQGNELTENITFDELTSQEVIWQPSNSACDFN